MNTGGVQCTALQSSLYSALVAMQCSSGGWGVLLEYSGGVYYMLLEFPYPHFVFMATIRDSPQPISEEIGKIQNTKRCKKMPLRYSGDTIRKIQLRCN